MYIARLKNQRRANVHRAPFRLTNLATCGKVYGANYKDERRKGSYVGGDIRYSTQTNDDFIF